MKNPKRLVEFNMNSSGARRLFSVAKRRPYPVTEDYESYIEWARTEVFAAFPPMVRELIRIMSEHPQPPGALIIRGLPLDLNLPPTPVGLEHALSRETHVAEAIVTALGANLPGTLLSYRNEKASLVQDLVPILGATSELSNRGAVELDLHVEHCFEPDDARANFVTLLGLRDDHEQLATTSWSDIRDILDRLSNKCIDELFRKLYRFRKPLLHGEADVTEPTSILSGSREFPQVRVALYGQMTTAVSRSAEVALRELRRVAAECTTQPRS